MNFNFIKNINDSDAKLRIYLVWETEEKETKSVDVLRNAANNYGISEIEEFIESEESIGKFTGKFGNIAKFLVKINGVVYNIVLFGIGKKNDFDMNVSQKIGAKLYNCVLSKYKKACIASEIDDVFLQEMIVAMGMRNFRFEKYKSEKTTNHALEHLDIVSTDMVEANSILNSRTLPLIESVNLTRNFVSEPPNELYPEKYASEIKQLEKIGLKVKIIPQKELEELKMGALLGVGQGSNYDSCVVVMEWMGDDKTDEVCAFVGKGVTFDTGGVSLKPSRGMWDMKYDMAGSAVVVGIMNFLAMSKKSINAVGVVALVENAIGGNAQRPSDIVTAMSGKTIEVLNTDAEGRLILADVLYYTQKNYKTKFMINFATLTGAIVVALGPYHAGLFSNNEELSEQLFTAGQDSLEKVWKMPLNKEYDDMIKSKFADIQNISTKGSGADSITAAKFLQHFVGDTKWAHLDIASVAWDSGKHNHCVPEGATGFGVKLIIRLLELYYS